ncbi:MAG TPA: hypothetical protein DHW40_11650 [Microbacterium sp.]|nr:hypothetical protein [Microbacterium sp.]
MTTAPAPHRPVGPAGLLPRVLSRRTGTIAIVALALVVVVTGLLFAVNADPLTVLQALIAGAFGTPRAFAETLLRAAPLLLIAVTLAPSLRARIFNLGAPGQMGAGAVAATLVALTFPALPAPLLLMCCALAATLAGMAAAVIPAIMKARWQINEIIATIAMNFLVFSLIQYLVSGPYRSATASTPQSDAIADAGWLPIMIEGTRAHWGLLIALAAAAGLFLFDRSRAGYRQKLFAANPSLSRQAGIHPRRMIFTVMITAGIGAGLAGWLQIAGVDHRLYTTVSDPVGYAGLFVALLGGSSPVGMIAAALLMGAILQGGQSLQIGAGLEPEIVQVFIGLILLGYAVISRVGAHR